MRQQARYDDMSDRYADRGQEAHPIIEAGDCQRSEAGQMGSSVYRQRPVQPRQIKRYRSVVWLSKPDTVMIRRMITEIKRC